jgi:hypothetical protein
VEKITRDSGVTVDIDSFFTAISGLFDGKDDACTVLEYFEFTFVSLCVWLCCLNPHFFLLFS